MRPLLLSLLLACSPFAAAVELSGGKWFLEFNHDPLIQKQVAECIQFEKAGNRHVAKACEEMRGRAFDYLRAQAKTSRLPVEIWMQCGEYWTIDYVLGARCMAAAEDICKVDGKGELIDRLGCTSVMNSSAWVVNPKAQSLDLRGSLATEEVPKARLNSPKRPSFDCSKASSRVEKLICTNELTAMHEAVMAELYQAALSKLDKMTRPLVVDSQKTWIKDVRDKCADHACLNKVFYDRSLVLANIYSTFSEGQPLR